MRSRFHSCRREGPTAPSCGSAAFRPTASCPSHSWRRTSCGCTVTTSAYQCARSAGARSTCFACCRRWPGQHASPPASVSAFPYAQEHWMDPDIVLEWDWLNDQLRHTLNPLYYTPMGAFIRNVPWVHPAFQVLQVLGTSLLLGTVCMLDLRL